MSKSLWFVLIFFPILLGPSLSELKHQRILTKACCYSSDIQHFILFELGGFLCLYRWNTGELMLVSHPFSKATSSSGPQGKQHWPFNTFLQKALPVQP